MSIKIIEINVKLKEQRRLYFFYDTTFRLVQCGVSQRLGMFYSVVVKSIKNYTSTILWHWMTMMLNLNGTLLSFFALTVSAKSNSEPPQLHMFWHWMTMPLYLKGTLLSFFAFTVFAKELLGDHIRCIRYSIYIPKVWKNQFFLSWILCWKRYLW